MTLGAAHRGGPGSVRSLNGIPLRLHRYWSGPERPSFVDEFEEQWRDLHPAWEITTWIDETIPPPTASLLRGFASGAKPESRLRHRANIIRYSLLYLFGGVWADCDVGPLRALDERVLDGRAFVASLYGRPEGAVMGGPPSHPFFAALVNGLRVAAEPGSSVRLSGQNHLERILSDYREVRRSPTWMFFTYDAGGRPIPGASYTEHLWASSRVPAKASPPRRVSTPAETGSPA